MTTNTTAKFDLLRFAIGLFVFLGIALTALGVYALLEPLGIVTSSGTAMMVVSGVLLMACALFVTTWLNWGGGSRAPRRSA